jgi:hypothetical protein
MRLHHTRAPRIAHTWMNTCIRTIGKYAGQVRMLLSEIGRLVLIPSSNYFTNAGATLEELMREVGG